MVTILNKSCLKLSSQSIKRLLVIGVFLVPLFLMLVASRVYANEKKDLARQYYEQGIELQENELPDSALSAFKLALKYDRKYADAYHQIARIYMARNTVYDRFRATNQLDKAIHLDWNNVDYRFTRALLFIEKGMNGSALEEFERVVRIDPDYYMSYYRMGLIVEEECLYQRDLIDPEASGVIYFRKFSEEQRKKVLYYYNKVIALNPHFTEVYYRLGLMYYEFGQLDEMISLLENAVHINEDDKNCHLFLGFAYHQQERFQEANQEYKAAMALMDDDELSVFNTIDLLLSPDEQKEFEKAGRYAQLQKQREFWQQRDPFFLTKTNERQLEHYSRVAYANLRFYIPLKKVDGWKTDQGQVYIRYGKPESMYRTRAELAMSNGGGGSVITSKEVWRYPDFDMIYEDRSLMRRYVFAWGDSPDNDYREIYNRLIREKPEEYNYLPDIKQLPVIADQVSFRGDSGLTVTNVNAALPGDSLHFILDGNNWQALIQSGIFLRDADWNPVTQDSGTVMVQEDELSSIGADRYFFISRDVTESPGTYHLSVEFQDKASGKRGVYRTDVVADTFTASGLQMSDILLATQIETDTLVRSLQRNELRITPNPVRKLVPGMPVYLYYEIYNLITDKNGMAFYKIDYRLGNDKQKDGVFRKFFTSLGLISQRGAITTSQEYSSSASTAYQSYRLNIPAHIQGNLKLDVIVTDLMNKQTSTKTIEFTMESLE
ncbi:GWxTD domain-containing protein [candidate division KSB1 bacterium]|nr:GWxTD domain-containing protein [candidate division KSB1 bacterium]